MNQKYMQAGKKELTKVDLIAYEKNEPAKYRKANLQACIRVHLYTLHTWI
jgi:hypothetical protein